MNTISYEDLNIAQCSSFIVSQERIYVHHIQDFTGLIWPASYSSPSRLYELDITSIPPGGIYTHRPSQQMTFAYCPTSPK